MTSRELCQKRMMSTGLEEVDTIDNITEASELIKYFGLSIKGLDSLDEMKNKFREHLKELGGTSSRKIGEVCSHSNTFSVQTSQIFVQNMINCPTICDSFSSWEGSPPEWYVSSNWNGSIPLVTKDRRRGNLSYNLAKRYENTVSGVPHNTFLEDRWFKIDTHGSKAETVRKYKL